MPNSASLLPLIERLSGVRVLVIGDAMIDHYVVGRVERISPEAPVPILKVEHEFDRVGGAANVAANLTSLGGIAPMVALCGGAEEIDLDGQRLRAKCEELGIEPHLIPALPCTVRKARMVAGQQQMLRVDWEFPRSASSDASQPFALCEKHALLRTETIQPLLDQAAVVLVSDYAKGMVDAQLMEQLQASGKPIVVDPRPRHREIYRGVTIITPNRKESMQMLAIDESLRPSGEELGTSLSEQLDCDILVTLGEEGMCLHERGAPCEPIPTRAREVFDVTGAGDTVVATLALGIGAGLGLSEAAHIANTAAGIVVGHIGTASVTQDELRAALEEDA